MTQADSENTVGFSLDDLALEDSTEVLVRTADEKIVRIKGQDGPWKLRLLRLRTPELRAINDKLRVQVANGKYTDDEATTTMLLNLVIGWSYGPENFSKAALEKLVTRPGFSWFRDLIYVAAADDKNFMKGI